MNVKAILLVLGAALFATACDQGAPGHEEKSASVRAKPVPAKLASASEPGIPLGQLPPNVEPLHYRLDLTLNPDQLRYEGLVEIDIELKAPKREIYLHGKDLVVSKIVARHDAGTLVTIPRYMADTIVTEWGVARLLDKNHRQRAEELISIAHPDFRADLRAQSKELWG